MNSACWSGMGKWFLSNLIFWIYISHVVSVQTRPNMVSLPVDPKEDLLTGTLCLGRVPTIKLRRVVHCALTVHASNVAYAGHPLSFRESGMLVDTRQRLSTWQAPNKKALLIGTISHVCVARGIKWTLCDSTGKGD